MPKLENPYKVITQLRRRIAALERDRMQARSLLLPGQVAVYRAAMRRDKALMDLRNCPSYGPVLTLTRRLGAANESLHRACARAEKLAKKGAKR